MLPAPRFRTLKRALRQTPRPAWLALAITALLPFIAHAAPPSPTTQPYRTDADPADSKLPWFSPRGAAFPPAHSSHDLAGELIWLDPVNRVGVLRPDRTDAQRRSDWDRPLPFALLPYGSIAYHGAPAELRDVPIGTHLHGQFYVWGDTPPPVTPYTDAKRAVDANFGRALRLEDDFSFCQRTHRTWRVDAVAPDATTLTVTGHTDDKPDLKPTLFQVGPYTRVWKSRSIAGLTDLAPNQSILLNLTVCTLKGPGRVTEIWLDPASRDVAATHQREVHRQYVREHGLAARIDAVDNHAGTVTATLFAGFDLPLAAEFKAHESITAAVAEDSLRTYDQINDRKSGAILAIDHAPPSPPSPPLAPGDSGLRITFKPVMLLEGFRPGRIVRLWPGKWKVDDLPQEERLYQ